MKPFHIRFSKTPSKAPNSSRLYLKLRSRLTLFFLLLVVIPCFAVTLAIHYHTRSLMEEKARQYALSVLEREMASVGRRLEELKLSLSASAERIAQIAEDLPSTEGRPPIKSDTLDIMIRDNFSLLQQKSLSAVYLIDESGIRAYAGSDAYNAAISGPTSQQWYIDTVKAAGDVRLLGTVQRFYSEGANRTVFCAAVSPKGVAGAESKTVLLYDFDYSLLTELLDRSEGTLILDYEGNILYCKDSGKLTTKADEAIRNIVSDPDGSFGRIRYKGEDQYLTYMRYPEFRWVFIDLEPERNITGRLWIRNPVFTAGIFLFPVVLVIYLIISLKLLRPINELTSVISGYEGQFPGDSSGITLPHSKASGSVFGSASDVDLLINKIYSIKLSQKEAELNSLQNQINPHFLYNTLESIRGAALYHGIHEIAAMSKALSLLFRYSISERVLVSIKEEMQHLENYISIQNFRYENKFEMHCSIPLELMNYKILKLTLQPLIENSIKHGLEMKLGKGTIRIEILELDDNIKILISDDGLGIPSKKLEELNRALASGRYQPESNGDRSSTGIGVMNVNSRIKLYFGAPYGLRFREMYAGTTVEITLPAVKEN